MVLIYHINRLMSTYLKLSVNDTYDLNSETLVTLDVVKKATNTYHILDKNASFHVKILEKDFNKKKYTITINGNTYVVSIIDDLEVLINDLGLTSKTAHKENEVKAPMPGLIVSVEIKEGQKVKEGDSLLVLEAMKMESTFTSPKEGIVQSISVKKGDTVDKGQVLVRIE